LPGNAYDLHYEPMPEFVKREFEMGHFLDQKNSASSGD